MILTRQEMFDRAWRGLASQGWRRAAAGSRCAYLTADGCRCAWGWVDPEGTADQLGTVRDLHTEGIGIAARLSHEDLIFAATLQSAHDLSSDDALQEDMRQFAFQRGLTVPA